MDYTIRVGSEDVAVYEADSPESAAAAYAEETYGAEVGTRRETGSPGMSGRFAAWSRGNPQSRIGESFGVR